MSQNQQKTLILSSIGDSFIEEEFGIDRLMDSLIQRLSKTIKNFDPSKNEISIRSGFKDRSKNHFPVKWISVNWTGEN